MEAISVKCVCILLITIIYGVSSAYGDKGPCPNSSPENEALKLAPCSDAAQNPNATVPPQCCNAVKKMLQNQACMCAIIQTAQKYGFDVQTALTIPKRCNISEKERHAGGNCAGYTVP
ncbi:Bifunctional inhibitor/lipid-transfer protein/seed storage 2S albumin superfamily protein [Striga hermonthica]|uniref:Bifunctional inhibitor/lipid-transfer protein/seed storage 2S albumin superfamily protein n=1 Tax=Striga hermonthica TaxID=68872 RepID=A0A9N7NCW1_STRHE|nr:Bifunctional inhibitor/lipid-transfer protein/seed storage 2S albumin superfamily protein [Striga hermonthica]